MRKMGLWLTAAVLLAGCGSYDVRDTHATVDRDPACTSRPDRPGEPVSPACERKTEATWSSERGERAPVDFSRKSKDD